MAGGRPDPGDQSARLYPFLESLTRKWWFYLLLFLMSFIPPWSARGYQGFKEMVDLIKYVAEVLIEKKLVLVPFMPYFHTALYLIFAALLIKGNRFGRFFSFFAGLHFLFILIMQTGAVTDRYGLVFYPNAFILMILISLTWIWEAVINKTDYSIHPVPPHRYLIVAAAIFSFWNPDKAGDFRLILFFTSTSPIAYCMMSTIYLALLCVLHPRVNLPLFRMTSFISAQIGVVTIAIGLFMDDPARGRYWSLLHTPMLATALYSFVLSLGREKRQIEIEVMPDMPGI